MSTVEKVNSIKEPASAIQSCSVPVSCCAPAPIGVFWDIENCSIPFHKSALSFVQKIRDRFFVNRKEAEFMCICDTSNQNKTTIQELNDAQVTVVHISAVSKNTADDKIRQSLRRFAADHKTPADVILISGDVNFASDLSDLRYRHHIHVILIHRRQVAVALTSCAHECVCFEDFLSDLPTRALPQTAEVIQELLVKNLPIGSGVQSRLQRLCKSVRGRILNIDGATALLRFPSNEATLRAQKLLDGESVLGQKIKVTFPGVDKNIPKGFKKQVLPAMLPNSEKGFQVAFSANGIERVNDSNHADSPFFSRSSQSCDVKKPAERSSVNNRTVRERTEEKSFSSACVGNVNGYFHSAEVLAGDIVIEDEEEEEACDAETGNNVPFQESSSCPNGEAVTVDKGINGSGYETAEVKHMSVANPSQNQKEGKLKCKKRHRSKNASEDKGLEANLDNDRIRKAISFRHRCSASASVNFSPVQTTAIDPSVVQEKGGTKAILSLSLCTMPTDTILKDAAVRSEGNSGNRISPYSPLHVCAQDLLCPSEHFDEETCLHPHCEAKKLSQQSAQLGQLCVPYSNHCVGCRGDEDGYIEKNPTGVTRTSTLWKCSPPYQVPLEGGLQSAGFRRTPGAKRPTKCLRNAENDSCTAFDRKPLFSLTSQKSIDGTSFIEDRGFPVSKNIVRCKSETEFLPNIDNVGLSSFGVDLVVSNLDYNISTHEWKKILMAEFQRHVPVTSVQMQPLQDNTSIGYIRVLCIEDARCAISQLHRKKIGYKRIHVALANNESQSSVANMKAEVVGLLREVAGNQLPLFKFIELFEKRYNRGFSVSELYHMKDTLEIIEQDGAGRTVVLLPTADAANASHSSDDEIQKSAVCQIHWYRRETSIFTNTLDMCNFPHVALQLRTFSAQVHKLLQTHDGSLPLVSFPCCYAEEFGELEALSEGGVLLEHLITCVPGVQISVSEGRIKNVQWVENRSSSSFPDKVRQNCSSPLIGQQMARFIREVVDLLRNSPHCRMQFSQFIPCYHHHFSRQLRIADFGYTKLLELFEAIPHVVQVIGNGSRKQITLTHRAQVKQFTNDLMRVLKSQASKQISALNLPAVYNKVIGKAFDINEYGVCFLEDMLDELLDSTVTIIGSGHDMIIAMPKIDQTPEEMMRTKQFAVETFDLLRLSPQYRMAFSEFIPAYHHHFGKQCRLADYGFTKLIELFEAIPNVIKVLDEQDEKFLCLTDVELMHILEDQIGTLLQTFPQKKIAVSNFQAAYLKLFGHTLRLSDFGVKSVPDLVNKIPSVAKIDVIDGSSFVCLVDRNNIQLLACNILLILMDQTDGSMSLESLIQCYKQRFGSSLNPQSLTTNLQGYVEVVMSRGRKVVKLTPLQTFSRDIRLLLLKSGGQLPLKLFGASYKRHYGVKLSPASYGFPGVLSLLEAVPHVVTMEGKGCRRVLILTQQFQAGSSMCTSQYKTLDDKAIRMASEYLKGIDGTSSDCGYLDQREIYDASLVVADEEEDFGGIRGCTTLEDLLSGPVPSNIPSPELLPLTQRPPSNLIRFDTLPSKQGMDFLMLSEEEKRGLRTPLCRTPVSDILAFAAQFLPTDVFEHRDLSADNYASEAGVSSSFLSLFPRDFETKASGGCDGKDLQHSAATGVSDVNSCNVVSDLQELNLSLSEECCEVCSGVSDVESCEGKLLSSLQADESFEAPRGIKMTFQMSKSQLEPSSKGVAQPELKMHRVKPENFLNLATLPAPEVIQKLESARRSRIAARFDL